MTSTPTPTPTLGERARATRTGSAGWMIQRLANSLNDGMKSALSRRDLTLDQFVLLMLLAEGDGLTQTEIGARVRLAGYTVTRALDALSARGFVERRPDPASRRAHRVILTAAGRAEMPTLFETVERSNAALLAPLVPEERRAIVGLLARLVAADQADQADQAGLADQAVKSPR